MTDGWLAEFAHMPVRFEFLNISRHITDEMAGAMLAQHQACSAVRVFYQRVRDVTCQASHQSHFNMDLVTSQSCVISAIRCGF